MSDGLIGSVDRTSPEDLSPVWWMLAGGAPGDSGEPRMPVVCALPDPNNDDWRTLIAESVKSAKADQAKIVVAVARPLPRLVLDLLARRAPRLARAPTPSRVREALREQGLSIEGEYKLWPSVRTPRVAFPASGSRPLVWAQRSGVLGGGGNRTWARIAARSPLFTPLALLLSPGIVFVAEAGAAGA